MKYIDKKNQRLVSTGEVASPDFWDNQWDVKNFEKTVKNGKNNWLVIRTTKKFVSPVKSKKIMEGGCGNGQFVYAFDELGYDSYGIDYAEKTISKIKSIFPKLKVSVGDVRNLDFPDEYFDGYWSVGVIEHFFDGYDPIIKEMKRVIKPGGFLFISFPHMSPFRKIKAALGCYPVFKEGSFNQKEFYEFILNHDSVIKKIKKEGFKLVKKIPYSGTKGFKDEIKIIKPLLQKAYDSNNIFLRAFNYGFSIVMSRFSSHSILLVFQKNNLKK